MFLRAVAPVGHRVNKVHGPRRESCRSCCVSKVIENIERVIGEAPAHRLIKLVRGVAIDDITREQALTLARGADRYELIVKSGIVRKMIFVPRAAPKWEKCYRNSESAAFPPWPGWHLRYE